MNTNYVRRSTKALSVIVLLLIVIVAGIFIYLLFRPCCPPSPPDDGCGEFGDEYLNGTYSVNAFALTGEGARVDDDVETTADPPAIAFEDNFEGVSPWDSSNDVDEDDTTSVHWDDESALFDQSNDGNAYLYASLGIPVDSDETVEAYFYVNIPSAWDGGDHGKGENDYFVLKIGFDDGNVLVYEVFGTYWSPSTYEAVIDVSFQVTMTGIWAGVNVNDIDGDYLLQFGGIMPTLPIPDIANITFELDSVDAGEDVFLDDVNLIVEPKPYTEGSYWKLVETGDHVTSYAVDVDYSILIDGVNNDTVHVQVTLFIEVYNGSTSEEDMVLSKTLVEQQLFLLDPEETSDSEGSPVVNTWTSKVFPLPADDSVLGSDLYYLFYVTFEAWGEVTTSPGDYVYASDDNGGDNVDSLHFEYIIVDASMDIIIYAASISSIAAGALGIIALVKKKVKGSKSPRIPSSTAVA